ncbi:MAG: hypothetical protein V4494_04150 [Chlamydiota bacterium]
MYGIHKDLATNTYTFCLWNTGEGIEYHHSRGEKHQLKATWSSLKFDQVSNRNFLEKLFLMKYQKGNTCQRTYRFIERYFRKAQDLPSDCTEDYRSEQSHVDCVWKSIWVAVADLLGRKEDPLLVSQAKAVAITTMRQNLLEKIIPKEANSIDPILIMAIKKIERRIIKKIISKAAIKALDQNENTYALKLKLLNQDNEKCFHTLSKIPEFTVDSYSLLRRSVRLGFLQNPKRIRKISCLLKDPMEQFQNLSEFKFRQLMNICKTEEGMHRYQELCKTFPEPQLNSMINKIAKTQKKLIGR